MKKIDIYTDGACSGNPGKGGCAWVAMDENGQELFRDSRGVRHTTNNRMEIAAVIYALRMLKNYLGGQESKDTDIKVTVYSDSQLLIKTMNDGWARKSNADCWQRLDMELDDITSNWIGRIASVTFEKVKGHSDNAGNVLADKMAVEAYGKPFEDMRIDGDYERIHPYHDYESAKPEKVTVTEIRLVGIDNPKPANRRVRVIFSDGDTATIKANNGGFETYDTTQERARLCVDIAWKYVGWLNGHKL